MYSQITPTFPDVPRDIPHDDLERIKDLLADEFYMKNSQDLTGILLDTNIRVDIIAKMLKQYTQIYVEMKEENDEIIRDFTAENFLQVLHMKISENMENEDSVRKKPRV